MILAEGLFAKETSSEWRCDVVDLGFTQGAVDIEFWMCTVGIPVYLQTDKSLIGDVESGVYFAPTAERRIR